ncbi:DUF4148 domain-containing protein [Allopusillimonas ginsengisoli]|nr:DUF4148 domain-containing protein [Allopusillimonas ginsengisoli]
MTYVRDGSRTRSEGRADLDLWKHAGLEELRKDERTPDTFSREYLEPYAEYARMHFGPEYQDKLKRQSAL